MLRIFKNYLFIVFGLFLFSISLGADDYSCSGQKGEFVSNIHNASSDSTMAYSTGEDIDEKARYFQFTTAVNGSITIRQKNNKPQGGYYNHKLSIGTDCGGKDLYSGSGSRDDSHTFDVVAGTTYYVHVKEANNKHKLNFDISFNFTAEVAVPDDSTTPISIEDPNFEECGVFPSALNTWDSIESGNNDDVINADTIYANGGLTGDITCTSAAGSSQSCNVAELDMNAPALPMFIQSTKTDNISLNGEQTDIEYGNVTVSSGSDVIFNPSSTYPNSSTKVMLIKSLKIEDSNTVVFNAGDYYIGSWESAANLTVRTNGVVRLFINSNMFLTGNFTDFNYDEGNGVASNMYVFIYGNFEFASNGGGNIQNMTAYVYTLGTYTANHNTANSKFKGAVSSVGKMSLNNNQEYTYDDTGLDESGFGACEDNFSCANPKEFMPVFSTNKHSKLLLIGNTSLCADNNKDGTCEDPGSARNNSIYMINNDFDGDPSTTVNSSAAKLDIPAGKEVLWAGLFWQGYFAGNSLTDTMKKTGKTIKYKFEGESYITESDTTMNWVYFSAKRMYYQSFVEITSYVKMHGGGYYWVGDLATTQGKPIGGSFGAWSLAVVYQDDDEVLKNTTVFHGYQAFAGSRDINNARSYATSNSCDTSNTGVGNNVSSTLDNFLTPQSGSVEASLVVFAGEGDLGASGDGGKLTNASGTAYSLTNTLNPSNDIMNATISSNGASVTNGKPFYSTNSLGADIDTYDVSGILQNNQTSTEITFFTSGDGYMPGIYALETQLYEPRVCYYINSIVDKSDVLIFDDGSFLPDSEMHAGEEYKFNFLISNMKEDVNDTTIEIANLVQVYLETPNFTYTPSSTYMKNTGANTLSLVTDLNSTEGLKDDLGERNFASNTSTFRLGYNASTEQGGTLYPASGFSDAANVVKLNMSGALNVDGNATTIKLTDFLRFRASFQTASITIGVDNAQAIPQCTDINDTVSVYSAPASAYNAVATTFDTTLDDPLASTNPLNALPTQVVNRNFILKIVSLNPTDLVTLEASSGDVNVSIIPTPNYTGNAITDQGLCDEAVSLSTPIPLAIDGLTNADISLSSPIALKSASVKITSNLNDPTSLLHSCSRDVFAIRPDRFALTLPGEDIELLHAGQDYNFRLTAPDALNNPSTGYILLNARSMLDATLDDMKTLYNPDGSDGTAMLNGTLMLGANEFDIKDGISMQQGGLLTNVVEIMFDDVGQVNMSFVDTNWSKVDIDNGDTPQDCSANGAYICGDINATFIPDHFALTGASLKNEGSQTYTYISNDLNISAGFDVTLTANNALGNPTVNFDSNSWENPVDVFFALPGVADNSVIANKSEIDTTQNLTFTAATRTINAADTNNSANLIFNYNRSADVKINPFSIMGTNTALNALSVYTSTSGAVDNITGTIVPDENATFVYGRTHAPRHRFTGSTGTAFIYYEIYCDGTINGNTCDKDLLPDGADSKTTDDPRWFVNTLHTNASGNVGTIAQKGAANVTADPATEANPAGVDLDFVNHATKGLPYKATMENNASSWLIYNPYDASDDTNEFEVEFVNGASDWAGTSETNTSTKRNASDTTNRRSMW